MDEKRADFSNSPRRSTIMVRSIRSVGIYVGDQDRAKQFFTASLGFDVIQDTPMGAEPGAPS